MLDYGISAHGEIGTLCPQFLFIKGFFDIKITCMVPNNFFLKSLGIFENKVVIPFILITSNSPVPCPAEISFYPQHFAYEYSPALSHPRGKTDNQKLDVLIVGGINIALCFCCQRFYALSFGNAQLLRPLRCSGPLLVYIIPYSSIHISYSVESHHPFC